ncbi:MAG TPA: hypothetical protein VNU28_03575 [Solirubrobacteraceae bacterium]|nr:hypothetical protein [Solirubrobacteraceae bacterium]
MASVRLLVGVVACLTVLAFASVLAGATSGRSNAGATGAYLRAADAFARAQAANVGASVAAMEKEASGIASGCPSVLAGAPKGAQLGVLGGEIASAVLFSSLAPDRKAILAFVGKVGALHWSDGTVAKLVRELAAEERASAQLALPDVCADLSAWKASGYRTLPSSTTGFIKAVEAVGKETRGAGGKEESLEEAVLRRLRPYETPADRRLAQQVNRVGETAAKRLLSSYSAALSHVGKVLGLEPA